MKWEENREGSRGRAAEAPKLAKVPPLLQHCAQWLECNGVVPRIFRRAPHDPKVVEQLLQRGGDPAFDIDAITDDPYAVAEAMLRYFRALPDAIVPPSALPKFESVYGKALTDAGVAQTVHEAVNQLDEGSFATLRFDSSPVYVRSYILLTNWRNAALCSSFSTSFQSSSWRRVWSRPIWSNGKRVAALLGIDAQRSLCRRAAGRLQSFAARRAFSRRAR